MISKVYTEVELPPTSNHIYVNRGRGGGRFKTKEATAWQNRALKKIIRGTGLGFQEGLDPNQRYFLVMVFYFESLENKGWFEFYKKGEKAGQRKAENRWKKFDLSNRIKLAEDTMKIAVGVDDCATMAHLLVKAEDRDNPRLVMQLLELPEVGVG